MGGGEKIAATKKINTLVTQSSNPLFVWEDESVLIRSNVYIYIQWRKKIITSEMKNDFFLFLFVFDFKLETFFKGYTHVYMYNII